MSYTNDYTRPELERNQLPTPYLQRTREFETLAIGTVQTVEAMRNLINHQLRTEAAAAAAIEDFNTPAPTPAERTIGSATVESAANDIDAARQNVDAAHQGVFQNVN